MESLTIPLRVFGAAEPCLFVELSGICIWVAISMAENAKIAMALRMILLLFVFPFCFQLNLCCTHRLILNFIG
jgi:hypothetical protein